MTTARSLNSSGLVLSAVALALGLILAAWVVASAFERIKRAGETITVKGYAEEKIISDVGVWRGELIARASELQAASKKLSADAARVQQFLQKLAGDQAKLTVGAVSMNTLYRFNEQGVMTGEVAGYRLEQRFELSSSDVGLIGSTTRAAGDLIREGIEFNSLPAQYFYNDLNAVKVRLLGAATRDARARAQEFASNSGVEVGALKSASQGVFQITQLNSTETADYGSYDTSTVEKVVKAVATIQYAVER